MKCRWCGRPIKSGKYCRRHKYPESKPMSDSSRTQSVCKHCPKQIAFRGNYWLQVETNGYLSDEFCKGNQNGRHEPAGEPPVSQEVADHNKYGVMRPRDGALRPSEPAAPRSLDRTTAVDVAGEIDYMKTVDAAPQTSADIAPYCCLEGYISNSTKHTCAAPQPEVEEIARQIAEKLVAHHLSVWQGLEKAIDLYTELIIPFLRPYYFPAAGASKDE